MANANVKVAQIGQTAVNRPIYEVQTPFAKSVFATNADGRYVFKNRAWLQSIGVNSMVVTDYVDTPSDDLSRMLSLDSQGMMPKGRAFPGVVLGSGLAFIADFKPYAGWKLLGPTNYLPFNY
ncbi:hypothetical protein [Spirosoma endophyticum]|uniref:Uncharacterized protein n=1 Tax=Spirosoma endophyticum TaxID=662367 RepID=A0A1I1UHP0_9BACT|nr:hypothetical protein [Spirosoma endophyticum]SFD67450.1 hypothetical protein SAMN05216167_106179 [Spirosoma endophyticum]